MKRTGTFYLGIDIGTGSVKVMLIDEKGRSLGSAALEYPTSYPKPGYVEQNPEDWYRQTCMAVQMLLEQRNIDRSQIVGVGICGTAHAPVLLDGNMQVLRPAILWSDQRSHREVMGLKTEAEEEIHTSTWNGIDCTWTLPQLLWIRRNEPDTYAKIQHLMISKDYIVYRFTGRIISDFSSAVSSLLVDANRLKWDIRLAQRAGLRLEMLSEILSPSDMAGKLTHKAATRIDSLSQRVSPGCDGLLFHPYLLGERVPHWNPNLRGSFTGLTVDHGKAHFFRAVQEGVAFSLRDCLSEVDWEGVAEARICGGGAKSRLWPKIIADVFGFPVVKMQYNDASTYGAALLAISAASGKGLSEIVHTTVRKKKRIEPDIETLNAYNACYERYRKTSETLVNQYSYSHAE